MSKKQGQYTHIVLLLDASSSMESLEDPVVQVVDKLVEGWKQQALDLDDMTRLSIYQFSSASYMSNGTFIKCSMYDTDIARIKSLKGQYKPHGGTALIDAVLYTQKELALTPTIHGDHTFLFYVITDGEEMHSRSRPGELVAAIGALPDNWTVAALVPNIHGKVTAQRYGFPPDNIMVWDTTAKGVEEVGRKVAQATASYMGMRTNSGLRSTRSLFVGGQVDAATIKAAKLTPLDTSEYAIVPVTPIQGLVMEKPLGRKPPEGKPDNRPMVAYMEIEPFINRAHPPFRVGKTYYELVKTERVKGNKRVALLEKDTSKVYVGDSVRQMLGLPDKDCTIKPDTNPKYKIYIESTSLNRHLLLNPPDHPRGDVLVLTK